MIYEGCPISALRSKAALFAPSARPVRFQIAREGIRGYGGHGGEGDPRKLFRFVY